MSYGSIAISDKSSVSLDDFPFDSDIGQAENAKEDAAMRLYSQQSAPVASMLMLVWVHPDIEIDLRGRRLTSS